MKEDQAMSLERFCREPVVTIQPKQSVHDAALMMRDRHVGAVLVVDEDRPVGIVTDRDIVVRAIVEGRDPNTTPVRDVMSRSLTVVRGDDKIDDAISAIRTAGVRRVPIVSAAGKPVGMVTLDDLVVLTAGELSMAAGAVQSNRGP
jgi:CBS domain-containing protein